MDEVDFMAEAGGEDELTIKMDNGNHLVNTRDTRMEFNATTTKNLGIYKQIAGTM